MSACHEKVAVAMKATHAAVSLNSYEEILKALHRRFPDEASLRIYVSYLENTARYFEPGFKLVRDDTHSGDPRCRVG